MKLNARVIYSDSFNPWFNLAAEEYYVKTVSDLFLSGKQEVVLFLWQNDNTVVIGRNQNAWMECKTLLLEEEGGKLARRSTGGGAVYHDLGNLNFSIITPREIYDTYRSLSLIVDAVNLAGINAEISGRNDILARGGKFSGNAFLVKKNAGLHHGTLLINSDYGRIARYLNVPKAKLEYKGIKSVKSRVVNLASLNDGVSVESMKKHVREAFIKEYNPEYIYEDVFLSEDKPGDFTDIFEKYSSWDWRYGESFKFEILMEKYFEWGNLRMEFTIASGFVDGAKIYTDSLDSVFFENLEKEFIGRKFEISGLLDALNAAEETSEILKFTGKSVKGDIENFIKEEMKGQA